MAVEVLLPKLGLTMEEGTVGEWLVEDGQEIAVGDMLLRLETDKVDVDVEAEAAGRIVLAVPAGATRPPGAVLAWLLADGEASPLTEPGSEQPTGAARVNASPYARRLARDGGLDVAALRGTGPGGRVIAEDVTDAMADRGPAPAGGDVEPGSPLVRRDAAALGVDLATVRGSGPGGKVTRSDVRAAAGSALAVEPARPDDGYDVVPLSGMRKTIASRMTASLQEMAQLTLGHDVTMDAAVALRADLKAQWGPRGIPVPSLTDLVVKAVGLALRDHPGLNASVVGSEIRRWRAVHVGLAVAVPDGLVVPVVRDADTLPLAAMAQRTSTIAAAAREGRLTLADLEGATFAVTSLGTYGVDFFTPVINPGNVAILGVGRLRDGVAWADDDTPRRTRVLTLSLSFDHRAVDGAPAAQFLTAVADLLEHPTVLLAQR